MKKIALFAIIALICASCGGGGGGGGGSSSPIIPSNPPLTPSEPPVEPPPIVQPPSTPGPDKDFTTQFGLLGLPNGTNPSSQMDTRWSNAKSLDQSGYFYPIFLDPAGTITVNSVNYQYTKIYGGSPMLRFVIDGNNIRVFGSDGTFVDSTITFDVVVIRSDGKGWFTAGSSKTIPGAGSPLEVTPSIPISSLTGTQISDVAGLNSGGYKVYAIVRSSTRFTTGLGIPDLNESALKNVNVIRIYPDAEVNL